MIDRPRAAKSAVQFAGGVASPPARNHRAAAGQGKARLTAIVEIDAISCGIIFPAAPSFHAPGRSVLRFGLPVLLAIAPPW
jgi:hypothetical protein